ncbi:hypothetical protein C0Q70_06712 [Pomacea canaliculata]|uniref:Uncharacterized protein n=2 Tax=Pomacea canaliculata TaxID=400727 RepID=A0A2T7PD11_POMCA|nr:hypothetical protein C0Q70_06712 [Pomacea canaliculata]
MNSQTLLIDLQTGNITGVVSNETGMEWIRKPLSTSCIRHKCNLRGVIKLTLNNSTRSMVKIDMKLAMYARGWTFHIGDSISNKGFGGDDSDQSNDAELHTVNDTFYIYAKEDKDKLEEGMDEDSDETHERLHMEPKYVKSDVIVKISDEFVSIDNNHKLVLLQSPKLFALKGQPDFQGLVNYDVYLGLNKAVGRADRVGEGLCKVNITFLSQ